MAIYSKGLQRPQRKPAKERRQRQISFKKPRIRKGKRPRPFSVKKGGQIINKKMGGTFFVASLYD
tara:strand:- start:1395 stop:1589 length:195 start_codon:yes stop_codon:yes gene_type:complete